MGRLIGTDESPILSLPLTELVRKIPVIVEGFKWNENVTFPFKPFIGTIGTSRLIDSMNILTSEKHGGNIDLFDICSGNIL